MIAPPRTCLQTNKQKDRSSLHLIQQSLGYLVFIPQLILCEGRKEVSKGRCKARQRETLWIGTNPRQPQDEYHSFCSIVSEREREITKIKTKTSNLNNNSDEHISEMQFA